MALGLFALAMCSLGAALVIPHERLKQFLTFFPDRLFLFPVSFFVLSFPFFMAWSYIHRPEVSRFIRTTRLFLFGLAGAYIGSIGFVVPKSVEYISDSGDYSQTLVVTVERMTEVNQPWVYLTLFLVSISAATILTWLYYVVARDERDNGELPSGIV